MSAISTPHSRKEKEVWETCDELVAENQKVTYQAVGDRLLQNGYKRGSNSDLCRYITTWRKQGTSESETSHHPSAPQEAGPSQKDLFDLLQYQQAQYERLFNALEASRKINQILQKRLYRLQERHKKLKRLLRRARPLT